MLIVCWAVWRGGRWGSRESGARFRENTHAAHRTPQAPTQTLQQTTHDNTKTTNKHQKHNSIGAPTLFATHFHELTDVEGPGGVANLHVGTRIEPGTGAGAGRLLVCTLDGA